MVVVLSNFVNGLISHLFGYQLKMEKRHSIFKYRAIYSHNNLLQCKNENNDLGARDGVWADVSCVMVYGSSILVSVINNS